MKSKNIKKNVLIIVLALFVSSVVTYSPMLFSSPLWLLRTSIGTHMVAYQFGIGGGALFAAVLHIVHNSIGMGSGVLLPVLVSLTLQGATTGFLYRIFPKNWKAYALLCLVNTVALRLINGLVPVLFRPDKSAAWSGMLEGYKQFFRLDFFSFLIANALSMAIGLGIVYGVNRLFGQDQRRPE